MRLPRRQVPSLGSLHRAVAGTLRSTVSPGAVMHGILHSDLTGAQTELDRIRTLDPAIARRMRVLVAFCPAGADGCRVVIVYATRRRQLLQLHGDIRRRPETQPVRDVHVFHRTNADGKGLSPHAAHWLDQEPGRVWTVDCAHGVYPVSADVIAATAGESGRCVIVGVSALAPPDTDR